MMDAISQEVLDAIEQERARHHCTDDHCPVLSTMVGGPHDREVCLQQRVLALVEKKSEWIAENGRPFDSYRLLRELEKEIGEL